MARSTFIYVSYIRTTPERLWQALTDPEFTEQYWFGMRAESTGTAGSDWKLVSQSGDVWDAGAIVEADPPRRLVIRWAHQMKPELRAEGDSICTMEIEPTEGVAVKLSITHTIEREHSKLVEAVGGGWPKVVSNLKSLLETGTAAMVAPQTVAKA
ncbi:MAG: SRPBCC family protein [Pseudomonadota bacterium]|nr:SRPBCC family protein [Pseudomonadota bacterium]